MSILLTKQQERKKRKILEIKIQNRKKKKNNFNLSFLFGLLISVIICLLIHRVQYLK